MKESQKDVTIESSCWTFLWDCSILRNHLQAAVVGNSNSNLPECTELGHFDARPPWSYDRPASTGVPIAHRVLHRWTDDFKPRLTSKENPSATNGRTQIIQGQRWVNDVCNFCKLFQKLQRSYPWFTEVTCVIILIMLMYMFTQAGRHLTCIPGAPCVCALEPDPVGLHTLSLIHI